MVDIATLPLNVLRSRIALVPQDPFIFAGTIRENIDPNGLHLDSSIWNAINQCLATPLVQQLGGLNAELSAGGSNLSTGQKQLLCLARALLKNSKVKYSTASVFRYRSTSNSTEQLTFTDRMH